MNVSVYRDASGAVVWAGMSRSDEKPDPLPPVPFDSWEVVVSSCNRSQALAVSHVLRRVYGLPAGVLGGFRRAQPVEVAGNWFPSLRAAAKALGASPRTLSRAVQEGYRVAGRTVSKAEDRPSPSPGRCDRAGRDDQAGFAGLEVNIPP